MSKMLTTINKTKPILLALSIQPLAWVLILLPFFGLKAFLALLLVPALVLLALPFASWDKTPTFDSNNAVSMIRGDLPRWARFLETPDERLPGGTYEPTVLKIYERCGRFITSWYWIGLRNQLWGVLKREPIDMGWIGEPGYYTNGKFWFIRKNLLGTKFQFKAGYRTYFTKGAWQAVPCCTITG